MMPDLQTPPRVAVITRTRDRPLFLRRAIQSVLGQTFTEWQHVIVNDGGDPQPIEVLLRQFASAYAGRVKVIHHPESLGMQAASNAGISASESEFITIHDDDDSWHRDFLRRTVRALDEAAPEDHVEGVVAQSQQIIEAVTASGEFATLRSSTYYYFEYATLEEMRRRNLFPPIAFLYRRRVHDTLGLFRQEYDVLGDYDFNLRFLRHFNINVLTDLLANYHWRHGSHGGTVTSALPVHREKLVRLKNDYLRRWLAQEPDAVGDLEAVEMPPAPGQRPPEFLGLAPEAEAPPPLPDPFADYPDLACLSLDVFDTALRRRCRDPLNVFDFLEARLIGQHGLPAYPYAQARVAAEASLREEQACDPSLKAIYEVLAQWAGLTPPQAQLAYEEELRIERELCYPDPTLKAWAEEALRRGLQLIYVSDMYLEPEDIRALLDQAGFPAGSVFVSHRFGCTKHEGRLFRELAAHLSLEPSRILHLGDNYQSDFVRAREAGWQALIIGRRYAASAWVDEAPPHYHTPADRLSHRFFGEVRRASLDPNWSTRPLLYRLGYEAAGPLYLGYMLWLRRRARQLGLKRLLFLARDGFYWEKVWHLLEAQEPSGITCAYFLASRKVLSFASFSTLNEEALEFLLTPNPSLSAKDFINRTGLSADNYLSLIAEAGFADPYRRLTSLDGGKFDDPSDYHRMRQVFLALRRPLEALFAEDREAVLQQAETLHFSATDTGVVDLGWYGSAAKTMAALTQTSPKTPLQCFYFGTWPGTARADSFRIHSYFLDYGKPDHHQHLLNESINWLEALHAAPHPTLLALRWREGQLVPEYARDGASGFSAEQQAEIWEGAASFVEHFLELPLDLGSGASGYTYLYLVLQRLLRKPAAREVALWGSLQHAEGFGLGRGQPLVPQVASPPDPDELIAAYHASKWKVGYLASLSPELAAFVQDRTRPRGAASYDEIANHLDFKIRETDRMWAENQRLLREIERTGKVWEADQAEIRRRGDELARLTGQVDILEKQLQDQLHSKAAVEAARQALESEMDQVRQQLDLWQGQMSASARLDLTQRLVTQEREQAALQEKAARDADQAEIQRLQSEAAQLTDQVRELYEQTKAQGRVWEESQAEIARLQALLSDAQAETARAKDALQESQEDAQRRQEVLEKTRADFLRLQELLNDCQAESARMNSLLAEATARPLRHLRRSWFG